MAAVIVLGSETGTTIKILLSGIGGNASKKRVVLGNLLFNVFSTIGAFLFLKQILYLITSVFKISDPLIGLVSFSTIINLLSIIIFLPFLNLFAKFLEKFFKDTDASASAFIGQANISEPETALDLFKMETKYYINNSILFNLTLFDINIDNISESSEFIDINEKRKYLTKTKEEKYEFLKQLQGELQRFYLELRIKLADKESSQLNQLISSVRSAMYSVKSMKDIENNIDNLNRSSKTIKHDLFILYKKETEDLYSNFYALIYQKENASVESLQKLYAVIQQKYSENLSAFYKKAQNGVIEDIDMTIIINLNRELYTSNKAMLMAIKDFLLNEKEAEKFNETSTSLS